MTSETTLSSLQDRMNQILMSSAECRSSEEATSILNKLLEPMFEKASDLDSQNRRLNIMLHFVKGEVVSEKERRKKLQKLAEHMKNNPKKTVNASTQEPSMDSDSDEEPGSIVVEEVDLDTKDNANSLVGNPDDDSFSYAMSFGHLFEEIPDPRDALIKEDAFESIQELMMKRAKKRKTKPLPEEAKALASEISLKTSKRSDSKPKKKKGRPRKHRDEPWCSPVEEEENSY